MKRIVTRKISGPMPYLVLLFLLLPVALFAVPDEGTEWPGWRGRNTDGIAQADGLFLNTKGLTLREAWKQPLGSGYSSIAVAHNKVVTMHSDSTFDRVAAFDAHTGKPLWSFNIDSTYKGHDGSHDGPISTPYIDKQLVFALAARGRLVALDAESGGITWEKQLAKEYNAQKPWYGFSSSPLVYKDLLILETAGPKGNVLTAFAKQTGEVVWSAGSDTVTYQSPMIYEFNNSPVVLAAANKSIAAIDPDNGNILWEVEHRSQDHPMGGGSMVPVPIERNTFLLKGSQDSRVISIRPTETGVDTITIWKDRAIRGTYSPPVVHQGNIYSFSSRFLTSVDAKTGQSHWKSRQPGDGFISLVDGHLIIQTKKGSVHIAKASPENYEEVASITPFTDDCWSPPSIAYGKIYVRSMGEIACLELVHGKVAQQTNGPEKAIADNTGFPAFIKSLEKEQDKKAAIDRFIERQSSFPIIEPNRVHFIYRGPAEDVAIAGDLAAGRNEEAMTRVEGTDLFYFSSPLESDARLNYNYVVNFDQTTIDSLNSRVDTTPRGPSSWFAMPDWREAAHLSPAGADTGRVDTMRFVSTVPADSGEGWTSDRRVDVYLPYNYGKSQERYPVVYVHDGPVALQQGLMKHSLDNLIRAKEIKPVIAVFIYQTDPPQRGEFFPGLLEKYSDMISDFLIPHIDKTYRTIAKPEARLNMATGQTAPAAFFTTFKKPGVFGNLSMQSMFMLTWFENILRPMVSAADSHPVSIYMDWGKYDLRGAQENWNAIEIGENISGYLRSRGYQPHTSMHNTGHGWGSWRNRTDIILKTFFAARTP